MPSALSPRTLLRGLAATACVATVPAAPAAAADTPQSINHQVLMSCVADPDPFEGFPFAQVMVPQVLGVRIRGTVPGTVPAGSPLTLDQVRAEFTWDPGVMRPQVDMVVGRMSAALASFAVTATGAAPASAPVFAPGVPAPITHGMQDFRMDTGFTGWAPVGVNDTFAPIGPFTANAAPGGSVELRLAPVRMLLSSPTTNGPAVMIDRAMTCTQTSAAPFATVPVVDPVVNPTVPVIASIWPRTTVPARFGGILRVRGRNLRGATSVMVGTRPAPFFVLGDSELWTYLPPQSPGQYQLKITTPSGVSSDTTRSLITYR